MLEIYIIRHGRTLFNQKDLVQGACDSPLTQEGVMQAKNVGKNMMDIPFTIALSSPSGRFKFYNPYKSSSDLVSPRKSE